MVSVYSRRHQDGLPLLAGQAAALYALNIEAYIEDLAVGRPCEAMVLSGHALVAAALRNALHFLVSDEDGLLTIDSWGIPIGAPHPGPAYRSNTQTAMFYAPLRGDLPEVLKLVQCAPALCPQASERHRLYFLELLKARYKRVIDQQWQSVKQQRRLHQPLTTELE